jgi:hypothetical protein
MAGGYHKGHAGNSTITSMMLPEGCAQGNSKLNLSMESLMAELTEEQRKVLALADKSGMILEGDPEICPGIHFCRDWDQMAVCADSPEAEGCACGRLKKS